MIENNDKGLHKSAINWYPGHMEKTKRLIREQFKNIDVVYEVIDARIPRSSKIKNIYEIIGDKPKILIMTKKDLADSVKAQDWLNYYQNLGFKTVLADLNDESDIKTIIDMTHELMAYVQEKREAQDMLQKNIRVLVVGIPNVGKSTLINRLAGKKAAKVGNRPGITTNLSWLKTEHGITLLDTPGILAPKLEDKEVALNLASFFSIKSEVIDVNEVAVHILNKLNKYYPNMLEERYNVKSDPIALNIEDAYNVIGNNIGAIKHGEVDYERVSNKIINDLKDGYIKGVVFDYDI